MSEPLSSHEIEDVLSSIRRLVSEELRPVPKAEPEVPVAAAAVARDSKLLLTPALRVVSDSARPAAPEVVAVPEAVAVASQPVPAPASMIPALDDDDAVWAAPGEPDTDFIEEELPRVAEAEAPGHWSADSPPEVEWVLDEEEWVEDEPAAFTAHPRRPAMTEEPLARAWAERAEAEVRATLEPPTAAAPEEGPGLFDQDERMIDEEMLRDLVREIIREELAGALGERITRNVRKLVRVEVNRAMTAREFG